jgi:hypothetical protein
VISWKSSIRRLAEYDAGMLDLRHKLSLLSGIATNAPTVMAQETVRTISVASFRRKNRARALARDLKSKAIPARVRSDGRSWVVEVDAELVGDANMALDELRRAAPELFVEPIWHHSGIVLAIMTSPATLVWAFVAQPRHAAVQLSVCLIFLVFLFGTTQDLKRQQIYQDRGPRLTITWLLLITAIVACCLGVGVAGSALMPPI